MPLLEIIVWAIIFETRLTFPPVSPIATILNKAEHDGVHKENVALSLPERTLA